jgi:uncharacterized membrane-anchored protein
MIGPTLTRVLTALGAILVLGLVNHSIRAKEHIISTGEPIYLALAPVDPRSLMQGDYMALRFQLADQIEQRWRDQASTGYLLAPISVDSRRVATLSAGNDETHRLRYRLRDGRVWLGTNAFFFEEGSAGRFTDARFGEFRLDRNSGEAVLVGLRDGQLRAL